MCGIAGIVALTADGPSMAGLQAMCGALRHRGPDDSAAVVRGRVGLAMTRLSIIDVAGGAQPYYSEDERIAAVFNGEIYNFQALRSRLEGRGHRFTTRADGEVIVHLWEEMGPAALDELEGMFAIALHDREARRLWLARDRVGIKPLFVARDGARVVFGSEIKALFAAGPVDRSVNDVALDEFLAWEYVPAPRTLFASVEKVEAGGLVTVGTDDASVERSRWWSLAPSPIDRGPREDLERRVDRTIHEAVRSQLVSDVPLGAFLSGGVDSSLVAAHMSPPPPSTFSIGFDDPSYDELAWSRRVAEHLGVRHHARVLAAEPAILDHLLGFMEDPIADFSIFPTYLVSRLAREHVTVALSGDGGDELFGGYETYVAQAVARSWERVPGPIRSLIADPLIRMRPSRRKKGFRNKLRRFFQGMAEPAELEHARWRLFVGERRRSELFEPEWLASLPPDAGEHVRKLFAEASGLDPVARRLYVDMRSYLADNCLVKVDRMSMAASLEVRVPLLATPVVETAFALPDRERLDGRTTKPLLKRVAARHVPATCVYRPKEGFSIPMKEWLRGELRPRLQDLLSAERLRREGRFRPQAVERLTREHMERKADHSHVLWALMVYQDWRDRWAA